MSNEVLTTEIYLTCIRMTNCNLVTFECVGCSQGFPRRCANRVTVKHRRWGFWSKTKGQSSKMTFPHHSPGQWENQEKYGTQINAMSSANFLHLDGAIMRSHNSYRAASCGCSSSHKMIIYFLWASVWSESNFWAFVAETSRGFSAFILS